MTGWPRQGEAQWPKVHSWGRRHPWSYKSCTGGALGITPLATTTAQLEEARTVTSQTGGSHSPDRFLSWALLPGACSLPLPPCR